MKRLEPNKQRSLAAMILLGIMILTQVASIILNLSRYSLLQSVDQGQMVTVEEAESSDAMVWYLTILTIIIFVGCVITYMMWFYRAYRNLHLIQDGVLYTSQWAILAWITPIVNLFRPQQIMRELYDMTRSYLVIKGVSRESLSSNRLISWWWGFWVISNFIGQADMSTTAKAKDIRELMEATIVSTFADIVLIIAGILAILVIKNYAQMEDELQHLSPQNEYILTDLSNHLIQ